MTAFSVKILSSDDWGMYRDLRLEALQTEPQAYPAHYDVEAAFNEKQWRRRASSAVAQGFVLLVKQQPVGMCSLIRHHPDTGLISHNYIRKEHRGQGGVVTMDLVRFQYARDHGMPFIEAMPCQNNQKSCQRLEGWGLSYEKIVTRESETGQTDRLALYRGNTAEILEKLQIRQASMAMPALV